MSEAPNKMIGNVHRPFSFEINPDYVDYIEQQLTTKTAECESKQAKIDALMFEYCPDEMTAKQIHDYGTAQHSVEPLDIPAFLRKGNNHDK